MTQWKNWKNTDTWHIRFLLFSKKEDVWQYQDSHLDLGFLGYNIDQTKPKDLLCFLNLLQVEIFYKLLKTITPSTIRKQLKLQLSRSSTLEKIAIAKPNSKSTGLTHLTYGTLHQSSYTQGTTLHILLYVLATCKVIMFFTQIDLRVDSSIKSLLSLAKVHLWLFLFWKKLCFQGSSLFSRWVHLRANCCLKILMFLVQLNIRVDFCVIIFYYSQGWTLLLCFIILNS